MSEQVREAEERLRQAEEERRSAESGYRQAIKHNRPDAERRTAYTKFKAARTRERAARVKLVKLQEASTSPSWGPIMDIDKYEACDRAVGETMVTEGKDQAGVINALKMARNSLIKGEDLGIAERIEAYAYVFEHVLEDSRGFFLFADACERMAKNWVEELEGEDIKKQTAAILKTYFPDIGELYIKNAAEYQRRKAAGQRALFGLAS